MDLYEDHNARKERLSRDAEIKSDHNKRFSRIQSEGHKKEKIEISSPSVTGEIQHKLTMKVKEREREIRAQEEVKRI